MKQIVYIGRHLIKLSLPRITDYMILFSWNVPLSSLGISTYKSLSSGDSKISGVSSPSFTLSPVKSKCKDLKNILLYGINKKTIKPLKQAARKENFNIFIFRLV